MSAAIDGERHRRPIQDIARYGLHLYQLIPARFQRLRQHQTAGGSRVKSVQLHRLRVGDVLGDILSSFDVANFKAESGQRNDFSRFRVLFHHFQLRFKRSVVDEVAVHLPLLADMHVKGRESLCALPAFCLFDRIHPSGQPLADGISILVGHQPVPFAFFSLLIASGSLEKHLEFRADLRCFNLCAAIVVVLQDGDAALNDRFPDSQRLPIVFHRVLAWLHAQLVFLCVQLVPQTGGNFLQRPASAARIPVGGEPPTSVCGIHLLQQAMTVQTILCSGQAPLSLRRAGFRVHLAHRQAPFLEPVDHGFVRHLVPLHEDILRGGNHIPLIGIDLLQHVRRVSRNQDIPELGDTSAVGFRIYLHPVARKRCAGQAERVPLQPVILAGLHHPQAAPLQCVAERDGCRLTGNHRHHLGFLRLVGAVHLFSHGVFTRQQIRDFQPPAVCCHKRVVQPVSGYKERNPVHLAVLRDLPDLHGPSGLDPRRRTKEERILRDAGHNLLFLGVPPHRDKYAMPGQRRQNPLERQGDVPLNRLRTGECQGVPIDFRCHPAVACCHGKARQRPLGIGYGYSVTTVALGLEHQRGICKARGCSMVPDPLQNLVVGRFRRSPFDEGPVLGVVTKRNRVCTVSLLVFPQHRLSGRHRVVNGPHPQLRRRPGRKAIERSQLQAILSYCS